MVLALQVCACGHLRSKHANLKARASGRACGPVMRAGTALRATLSAAAWLRAQDETMDDSAARAATKAATGVEEMRNTQA